MIPNWYEGEPVSDVRLNQIVNALNALAVGTPGIATFFATDQASLVGTWVVPAGITSSTRLRVSFQGQNPNTPDDGPAALCGYAVLTGYSAGQSIPYKLGNGFYGIPATDFNSGVLISYNSPGGLGGSAPSFPTSPKGGGSSIVIEW